MKSQCFSDIEMFKKAFSISAINAILFTRKRIKTQFSRVVKEGPECKQSFSEGPEIVALTSNTILVVTLSSLITGL